MMNAPVAKVEEPAKPAEPARPAQPVIFEVTNAPKAASVSQTPPPAQPPAEEKKVFHLNTDPAPKAGAATPPPPPGNVEKPLNSRGVEERLARRRELSLKLRTPNGLVDLEREPAFRRKNVTLTESPQSTDSNISRYSLTEGTDENGEKRVELKRNNPYLHDNVD
jgi:cell division protein FtsZ